MTPTLLGLALAMPVALVACMLSGQRPLLPRVRHVVCRAHRTWDYACERCSRQMRDELEVVWR